MLHVFLRVVPKIRDSELSGEDCGNQKGFVDLNHELALQQLHFLGVCEVILNHTLASAAVIRFGHIPGGGLIAQALACAHKALQQLEEAGCFAAAIAGVDGDCIITGVHFRNEAGGQHFARVGRAVFVGVVSGAALEAAGGNGSLDEQGKAGGDSLFHRNGSDKLVGVPDAAQTRGKVADLSKLRGAALAVIENNIFSGVEDRLVGFPAVNVVLLYPIPHGPVVLVVLNAANDAISLVPGRGHRAG